MVPVAALAATAALALSGCSAGQVSQTADQVAAVNGNSADADRISLRNAHIVFPSADAGEYNNSKGGKALVALSIINNGETIADELTSVKTDLGTVVLTPPAGKSAIQLAPQQTVVAANKPANAKPADSHGGGHGASAAPSAPATKPAADDPEGNPARIEIVDLSRDIAPGLTYTMTFNFKQNGTVQIEVPVDAGISAERHESDKSKSEEKKPAGGGH